MFKRSIDAASGRRILLVDSITTLNDADTGAVVVAASHGGTSAGEFALAVPLAAVFFNDAGVGKDCAGIAALDMLQDKGIPAGAVSHMSARIGDAEDMWQNGIISHVNRLAQQLGLAPGMPLRQSLLQSVSLAD